MYELQQRGQDKGYEKMNKERLMDKGRDGHYIQYWMENVWIARKKNMSRVTSYQNEEEKYIKNYLKYWKGGMAYDAMELKFKVLSDLT